MVENGAKHSGIISPILFYVYLNGLLCKLQAAGIECRIGSFFTGVFVYADAIVLLAPTVRAMRYMRKLCDDYANAFSIMLNETKYKCVIVKPPRMCAYTEPYFYIGGNRFEIVDRWQHLGHMVDCQCNDSAAILNGRNSLVGQKNNVLCTFKSVGTIVTVKLMKAYCSSLYGSVFVEFMA